jgi:biopolymer transport protein TolR
MDSGIDIDVPKTQKINTITKDIPVVVSVTKDGELYLGESPININNLVNEIHKRYPGQNDVFIKASAETTMDIGVNVMSVLGNAKFGIKVVTQLDEGKR